MARGDAEMRIRVPHDLKSWLEEEAKENVRSQTAQIVHLLRRAKAAGGEFGDTAPAAGSEAAARQGSAV